MARAYIINGPTLVKVTLPVNATVGGGEFELGVASEPITVSPKFSHLDVHSDDFGDQIPPEVLWMGAETSIEMTLVHYDYDVLLACLTEAMGGKDGSGLAGFGTPMGGGKSGNHYIKLTLTSPTLSDPWNFTSAYLSENPIVHPLGVERSLTKLTWRSIPYKALAKDSDVISAGASLWT